MPPELFRQEGNAGIDQIPERAGHVHVAIQGQHELRPGLVDHLAVVGERGAAAAFGSIFGYGAIRIVHADDIEFSFCKIFK